MQQERSYSYMRTCMYACFYLTCNVHDKRRSEEASIRITLRCLIPLFKHTLRYICCYFQTMSKITSYIMAHYGNVTVFEVFRSFL